MEDIEDLKEDTEVVKKKHTKKRGKAKDIAFDEVMGTYLQYVAGTSVELMEEIVKLGKESYELLKPVAESSGKKPSELLLEIISFWHTYKDKVKNMEEELSRLRLANALLKKYVTELTEKGYLELEKLRLLILIYVIGMLKGIRPEVIEEYVKNIFKEDEKKIFKDVDNFINHENK